MEILNDPYAYEICERAQPLPPDSLANAMNICNVISLFISIVTVIITPDAKCLLGNGTPAKFVISCISLTLLAGMYEMLKVPEVAL